MKNKTLDDQIPEIDTKDKANHQNKASFIRSKYSNPYETEDQINQIMAQRIMEQDPYRDEELLEAQLMKNPELRKFINDHEQLIDQTLEKLVEENQSIKEDIKQKNVKLITPLVNNKNSKNQKVSENKSPPKGKIAESTEIKSEATNIK